MNVTAKELIDYQTDDLNDIKETLQKANFDIAYGETYSIKEVRSFIKAKQPVFATIENGLKEDTLFFVGEDAKNLIAYKDGQSYAIPDKDLKKAWTGEIVAVLHKAEVIGDDAGMEKPSFVIFDSDRDRWEKEFGNVIERSKIRIADIKNLPEQVLPAHPVIVTFDKPNAKEKKDNVRAFTNGAEIRILDPSDPVTEFLHEIGHIYWSTRLNKVEKKVFDKLLKKIDKKNPPGIFLAKWDLAYPEELFATVYYWYLKGLLSNEGYLQILSQQYPIGAKEMSKIFDRVNNDLQTDVALKAQLEFAESEWKSNETNVLRWINKLSGVPTLTSVKGKGLLKAHIPARKPKPVFIPESLEYETIVELGEREWVLIKAGLLRDRILVIKNNRLDTRFMELKKAKYEYLPIRKAYKANGKEIFRLSYVSPSNFAKAREGLVPVKVWIKKKGKPFLQTVWKKISEIAKDEKQVQVGEGITEMAGLEISRYSEKALIVRGKTYENVETLREIKSNLGTGSWNSKLKGWVFPYRYVGAVYAQLSGKLSENIESKNEEIQAELPFGDTIGTEPEKPEPTEKDVAKKKAELKERQQKLKEKQKQIAKLEEEQEKLKLLTNALEPGSKMLFRGEKVEIVEPKIVEGELWYWVKKMGGALGEAPNKELESIPEKSNKQIGEEINSVSPETRKKAEKKLMGAKEGNPEDNVPKDDYIPEPVEIDVPFGDPPKMMTMDYTGFRPDSILLVNKKTVLDVPRPAYIPEISDKFFRYVGHRVEVVKLGPDKYVIRTQSKGRTAAGEEQEAKYVIVSRDVFVATQDYYVKRAKALNTKTAQELSEKYGRKYKAKRVSIMSKNRMSYGNDNLIGMFHPVMSRYQVVPKAEQRSAFDILHETLQDLKYRTNDMEIQREELENSYDKGEETSYGEIGAKSDLLKSYGVKVKRQNGSEITNAEVSQIKSALNYVYDVFGNRKSMSKKFNLKISHSGDVLMHARKAMGLFFPRFQAIGVSAKYGNPHFGLTLSHEYGHFMDYYLGQGKRRHYSSDDPNHRSNEIAVTFRDSMAKEQKSNYQNRTCECFARAMEQYFSTKKNDLNTLRSRDQGNYCEQQTFMSKIYPLIEKFFTENNELLKAMVKDLKVFSLDEQEQKTWNPILGAAAKGFRAVKKLLAKKNTSE